MELHCPYCKDFRVDLSNARDSVNMDDLEHGSLILTGVLCRHSWCKGSKEGFQVRIGYVVDEDDVYYYDVDGGEIRDDSNIH